MSVIERRRGGESLDLLYNVIDDETTGAIHQNIDNSGSIITGTLEGMQDLKGSIDRRGGVIAETDDRSSSLSEIEDGTVTEVLQNGKAEPIADADGNDTEAETERLEDSPQKLRSYKNVVLTASNDTEHVDVHVNGIKVVASGQQTPNLAQEHDDDPNHEGPSSAYTSDNISPESRFLQRTGKHRKKRKASSGDVDEAQRLGVERSRSASLGWTKTEDDLIHSGVMNSLGHSTTSAGIGGSIRQASGERSIKHVSTKQKATKGKRKGKAVGSQDFVHVEIIHTQETLEHAGSDIMEGIESHGEDEEMEDVEVDIATRTEEETSKKKSAMAALSAIEKCFATLRDKLFDERLARYNEELVMLNQAEPTHPEYLAQMECVDENRNKKIEYEQTLMKYKLMALQRTNIAEKAQAHSQYLQTIRDIRDRALEQVSKQSFQIQRERRDRIGRVPDYSFQYPARRSQQIINQTAYNAEVSILSGVAKYVGFPAAPEMHGALPEEVDEDLRNMRISMDAREVQPAILDHQRSLRANDTTAATDHFLEKNAWANPRHPSHSRRLRRHASGLGQDAMSFVTPVTQKRLFSNGLEGSASTIVEASSGQNSSALPTSFAGAQLTDSKQYLPLETPSKAQEGMAGVSADMTSLQNSAFEHPYKLAAGLAKGLPDLSTTRPPEIGSRNVRRQSEDASHVPHRSPFYQRPNPTTTNGIASSGQA